MISRICSFVKQVINESPPEEKLLSKHSFIAFSITLNSFADLFWILFEEVMSKSIFFLFNSSIASPSK